MPTGWMLSRRNRALQKMRGRGGVSKNQECLFLFLSISLSLQTHTCTPPVCTQITHVYIVHNSLLPIAIDYNKLFSLVPRPFGGTRLQIIILNHTQFHLLSTAQKLTVTYILTRKQRTEPRQQPWLWYRTPWCQSDWQRYNGHSSRTCCCLETVGSFFSSWWGYTWPLDDYKLNMERLLIQPSQFNYRPTTVHKEVSQRSCAKYEEPSL